MYSNESINKHIIFITIILSYKCSVPFQTNSNGTLIFLASHMYQINQDECVLKEFRI